MNAEKFAYALKAKFGSHKAVLRALGMDENLLDDNTGNKTFAEELSALCKRYGDSLNGGMIRDALPALIDGLEPEELETILDDLTQFAGGQESFDRRHRTDDRRHQHDRRPGRDEPEPFSGRPRPGGEMDPISAEYARRDAEDRRRAADARRRFRGAADSMPSSASVKSFNEMFPTATSGNGVISFENLYR